MANNRMLLICNVCHPLGTEWDYKAIQDGSVVSMAKWYPVGTYANINAEGVNEMLEAHDHPEIASEHYAAGAGQDNPVRLEYESIDLPLLKEDNRKLT